MSIINTGTRITGEQRPEFENFLKVVDYGRSGTNEGISFGLPKLDNYLSLRGGMLYALGGFTGSGKTSYADEVFVLRPLYHLAREGNLGKLRIVYWSMERKKAIKIARWVSRHIFLTEGIIIPMKKILGWVKRTERLTHDEHDLIVGCTSYFNELFEYVTIIDGRQNPTGIRKYTEQLAGKHGIIEEIDKYNKIYIPNDPSIIWLHLFDHVGKLKKEQNKNLKEVIDDFCDDVSDITRDFYGHSALILSQLNRDITNPMRLKAGDVEPRLEDFKNTGDLTEDADCVLSLFDPYRYKVPDPAGYDLSKFRDVEGAKKYRNIKILKNTYGPEDIRMGLGYQPQTGIFRELPKKDDMTDDVYDSVIDNSFFQD